MSPQCPHTPASLATHRVHLQARASTRTTCLPRCQATTNTMNHRRLQGAVHLLSSQAGQPYKALPLCTNFKILKPRTGLLGPGQHYDTTATPMKYRSKLAHECSDWTLLTTTTSHLTHHLFILHNSISPNLEPDTELLY